MPRHLPRLPLAAVFAASLTFAAPSPAPAQQAPPYNYGSARPLPVDRGAAALWQDLQKLKTRASLIMIVAHPDDEDGPMLTYESRVLGVDASLLTLTRGEGGQNIMSSDLWDQLGIVRTEELLAAGQYYGVHQYFTRVTDYGFSKTLEEAFKEWGHDRVLRDVVRIVRQTRPLVVTAVFVGGVSDGHGHHQVSGEMAQEVFNAAADPAVFPDQIAEGLLPWAPLKVYARIPFARVTPQGIFDYATNRYSPAEFHDYVHNTTIQGLPSTTVEIPVGGNIPLLGDSPVSLARQGLSQQKSQNGGIGVPRPGPASSGYHLYASRLSPTLPPRESGFFDGIDTGLTAIAAYAPPAQQAAWQPRLAALAATVNQAAAAFDATVPAKAAPALARGLQQTEALLADLRASSLPPGARYNMEHELLLKRDQFNQALNDALGVSLLAVAESAAPRRGPGGGGGGEGEGPGGRDPSFQSVTPGESFRVTLHLAAENTEPITVASTRLVSHAGVSDWTFTPNPAVTSAPTPTGPPTAAPVATAPAPATIPPGQAIDQSFTVTVPDTAAVTKPYFARNNVEQSFYNLLEPQDSGLPTAPYPLSAEAAYTYAAVTAHISAVVQATHRYIGPGPLPEPLLVAPAISLTVSPTAGIVPMTNASLHVEVRVHSSVQGASQGSVHLDLPAGWSSEPASAPFATEAYNEERMLSFTITPKAVAARPYTITAVAESAGKTYREGFQTVGYVPLRPYPFYRDATYQVTGVDLKIAPNLRIAYIMGTGDDVPQSLEDLGIRVTMLSAQDFANADLSGYDAILLGIRTYAARPDLAHANQRLLNYARNGGTVIVQYQSAEFNPTLAPFPITLGGNGDRVVEEDNAVAILAPSDPLLTFPNRITSADFSGWIEERGHGFPASWAPQYTALTETHDPGQDPQRGGLLYARTGKGLYIYTAFAFFREMPEGVPGSFRLMANLLSARRNPALQ